MQGATFLIGWGGNYAGSTQAATNLTNVIAVSAGNGFGLALKNDGTVTGWGENNSGQTSIPVGLSNVVAIAAGVEHSLALKNDGTVAAWGQNDQGQSTVPAALSNVVAIAAGDRHSLVLKADGTIYAWGYNSFGETNVPAGLSNVVGIAAGYLHSLALKSDGTVVAWGDDRYEQTIVPAGLSNVVALTAGYAHNLALKGDGTVATWGNNGYAPPDLSNVVAIAAGSYHSLALKSDGTVVGWGYNVNGQATIPIGLSRVTAIAAGGIDSLALNDGSPVVLRNPSDLTIYSGIDAYFGAQVAGLPPLSLQWQLNETSVTAATNTYLVLTNAQMVQAGNYRLVISNAVGRIASLPGVLTVNSTLPIITKQPTSLVAMPGTNPTFSTAVDGSQPFHFQWRFQGQNIAGATDSVLTLAGVQLSNQGEYDVVVSNPNGSVTSTNAHLTVLPVWGRGYYNLSGFPPDTTNVLSIAMNGSHSLALKSDGTVVACGNIGGNPADVPPGLAGVVA